MSTDPVLRKALEEAVGKKVFYFEIVLIHNGPIEKLRCLMCLSKHSVLFIREDLSTKIHAGAELMYAHIDGVVTDNNSSNVLLLRLSENRPQEWESERLYIHSENRIRFVRYLRSSYQADFMWRMGKCFPFPLASFDLTPGRAMQPSVAPFSGCTWRANGIYKFMVPDEFRPVESAGERLAVFQDARGRELKVTVHSRLTLEQLKLQRMEHVRWLAAAYKVFLLDGVDNFYFMHNMQYRRSMNLAGDPSAWLGWELSFRTEEEVVLCIILRRQYIPPVLDSVDDMSIVLRCPNKDISAKALRTLHQEIKLVADTLRAHSESFPVYWKFVQAKLDALHFDEEASIWISSHMKLHSRWRREAKIFLRMILSLYIADDVYQDTDNIMNKSGKEVLAAPADEDEEWCELEANPAGLEDFLNRLKTCGEGLPVESEEGDDDEGEAEEKRKRIHSRWLVRVSSYFAWAIDGGLLGNRFNIDNMLENTHGLTEANLKLVMKALEFLLHIRLRDMTRPWTDDGRVRQLNNLTNLSDWTFNERVMQAILHTEYLRKQFPRNYDGEYCRCLASISDGDCSVVLKSAICRLFMETEFSNIEDVMRAVIPHLLKMLREEGVYLQIYACATMVNLCSGNDLAKQLAMAGGIGKLAIKQVASKEDDLALYTLMLLVNLTKEAQHRYIIAKEEFLPKLYDMLTSNYQQCKQVVSMEFETHHTVTIKEKILTQLCTLIGQFCTDEEYRLRFLDTFQHTIACLLYIYEFCTAASALQGKALFALKQLASSRDATKRHVGVQVIEPLIAALGNDQLHKSIDYVNQALLLLIVLSGTRENCQRMRNVAVEKALVTEGRTGWNTDPTKTRIETLLSTIRATIDRVNM